MASYTVECDNCMSKFHSDSHWEIGDFIERCEACTNDVCEKCASKESSSMHQSCLEGRTEEDPAK